MKTHLKMYGYFYGILVILSLILSLFNTFNWFSFNVTKIILNISLIIYFMITGYHVNKRINNKAYINGLKYGGILIIGFLIISIFLSFSKGMFLYYIILFSSFLLGTILNNVLKKTTR